MKTSELIGPALAWAVGTAEGCKMETWHTKAVTILFPGAPRAVPWNPHANWAQGGPIIEREGISVVRMDDDYETDDDGFCTNVRIPVWAASTGQHTIFEDEDICFDCEQFGTTPLIATMRCYVASRLGDEVDVPKELTNNH